MASGKWWFAAWYGDLPDGKAFLEEDKNRTGAVSVHQSAAQVPYEAITRPVEDRVLDWVPTLEKSSYTVQAKLVYDLNRYNTFCQRPDGNQPCIPVGQGI